MGRTSWGFVALLLFCLVELGLNDYNEHSDSFV
jgi:hypothetical protein